MKARLGWLSRYSLWAMGVVGMVAGCGSPPPPEVPLAAQSWETVVVTAQPLPLRRTLVGSLVAEDQVH
ncbi:MAG: hypothetical protein Q6L49_11400 [Thermostichales cyanobacterium HHBFW_bins_127]